MNTTCQPTPVETITKDLIYRFVNLMYAGWSPEVIQHKMGISPETLAAIHRVYFNQTK